MTRPQEPIPGQAADQNLFDIPGPMITEQEERDLWRHLDRLPHGIQARAAFLNTVPLLFLSVPARLHLAEDRGARILNPALRAAYTVFIWQAQIEAARQPASGICPLPPCTWCGLPTGSWCDHCGKAVCTNCDEQFPSCRPCWES